MPYRPTSQHRRNVRGVIYPLTEAVRRLYGCREEDGAYPLGAFYTVNIDSKIWVHADGIWYRPKSEQDIGARIVDEETVYRFITGIQTGASVELSNGRIVTWERMSDTMASELPS